MDQEIGKVAHLSTSLIATVAALTLIFIIYGVTRTMSMGYMDKIGEATVSTNMSELRELNTYTSPITKESFLGIIERNGKYITKCVVYTPSGTNTFTQAASNLNVVSIKDKLKTNYKTTYNMKVNIIDDMNIEITVWAR